MKRKLPIPVVDTSTLTRKEWLEYRKHGIGASDMSVIMGENQYKTSIRLWEEKASRLPIEELEKMVSDRISDDKNHIETTSSPLTGDGNNDIYNSPITDPNEKYNLTTSVGHALEPVVAEYLSCKLGLPVYKDTMMYRHPDYPFLFVDLDYIMLAPDENGELCKPIIVECKTATYWKKDEWEHGVPPAYEIQCRMAMAVFDVDEVIITCLLDNNESGVFTHHVYRDAMIEADLIMEAKKFWELVESKTLYLPKLAPKLAFREMVQHRRNYEIIDPPAVISDTAFNKLVQEYENQYLITAEKEERFNEQKEKLDMLKLKLSTYMLSYNKLKYGALTLSWVEKSTKSTDIEALRFVNPALYAKIVTEKDSSYFKIHVNPSQIGKIKEAA